MRKRLLGLLISLMIPIFCLSKTIYQDTLLTQQDYKKIALILNEHNKLKIENKLLYQKIGNYDKLLKSYDKTDSLYRWQLNVYKNDLDSKEEEIILLNKKASIYKTASFVLVLGWIMYLILK